MVIGCMLAALFGSAVRLPAIVCPVSSPPVGEACKPGSCPNKACCAKAEKNKSLPATAPLVTGNDSTQELLAVLSPVVTNGLVIARPVERQVDLLTHRVAYFTTPKRAFLCTFLI
jgi:hypothetical protein